MTIKITKKPDCWTPLLSKAGSHNRRERFKREREREREREWQYVISFHIDVPCIGIRKPTNTQL